MNNRTIVRVIAFLLAIVTVCAFVGCKKTDEEQTKTVEVFAYAKDYALTRPLFIYAFNSAINDVYDLDDERLDFTLFGSEEFLTSLKETEKEEGVSYYDYAIEKTLDYLLTTSAGILMTKEAGQWETDSELEVIAASVREQIEEAYYTYMAYYDWDIDELCMYMFNMPGYDYSYYYAVNYVVGKYLDSIKDQIEVTDEEIEAFYNEDPSAYRTVKVRHSLFMTTDMNDTEKAALYAKLEGYIQKYNNDEMTMDEIVALSEDGGLSTNDGYYDVTSSSNYVESFKNWALDHSEVTEELGIVESTYGYHIMQCVSITGIEDDTVKKTVKEAYQSSKVDTLVTEWRDTNQLELSNVNDALVEKYIRMYITCNFSEVEPTPVPTATPLPSANDAPASTRFVGYVISNELTKADDVKLWGSEIYYFLSTAISEVISDKDLFEDADTTAQRYEKLRLFLDTTYEDKGVTYKQYCEDRAIKLLLELKATYYMALETEEPYTEDEISDLISSVDTMVDQYLSYYGGYYGTETRDEYMIYTAGMNVNDYKRFYLVKNYATEYADAFKEGHTCTESELKAFYDSHIDVYKIMTVRHITLSCLDSTGAKLDEASITAKKSTAQKLVNKLKNGDDVAALVTAYSADSNASTDGGLVDMSGDNATLGEDILAWAKAQTTVGVDTCKIFDLGDTIEVVYMEGILEYNKQLGTTYDEELTLEELATTIESALENELFADKLEYYMTEHNFAVGEKDQATLDAIMDEFMTYSE